MNFLGFFIQTYIHTAWRALIERILLSGYCLIFVRTKVRAIGNKKIKKPEAMHYTVKQHGNLRTREN